MSGLPAIDPAVSASLRGALALLFAAAALHKLRDPGVFRAALADYALLPAAAVAPAARLLPALELAAAAALLVPAWAVPGGLGAAALLAVYGGAIAVNLARGRRDVACGCLGPAAEQPLSGALLIRNGVLVAAALLAACPASARAWTGLDALTVPVAVAAAAGLYAAWEGLLANARRQRAWEAGP